MGPKVLKWLASLGSGALTSAVLWLLVAIAHLDLTSTEGAAIATIVGTLIVKFVTWATSKYGAAPVPPAMSARRTRAPRANGPNHPTDLGPTG